MKSERAKKRVPKVGEVWMYRGTRWKGSEIHITSVTKTHVRYYSARQATTRLDLFHRRFAPWAPQPAPPVHVTACRVPD